MHAKQYTNVSIPLFSKGGQGPSNEKGMVLVVGLMLIVVLSLLGTTAVLTSTTDMKISANYKTSKQAFYAAEAGIEEARARLKANADMSIVITDSQPLNANWRAYIGVVAKAQAKGYDSSQHGFYPGLQSTLDYTVKIKHRTNAGGQVLYWGDVDSNGRYERTTNRVSPTGFTNPNIYLVTSYGTTAGSNKTIESEITRFPPLTVPAALYVEAATDILGNASIFGVDQCGGADVPGIKTTLSLNSVDDSKNPGSLITGSTSPTGNPSDIAPFATDMDIQAMIDSQKGSANFTYNVASATHSGTAIPGPGDGWGTPVPGASNDKASSCDVRNIVYYNTSNGNNLTDIKLTNSSGCGILLVEGDLDVNGGFNWYGLVIVSGSVKYTGGGQDSKNITGGVLAGGSATADVVGGNTNIVYCSTALTKQTENQPLRCLSWNEQNI